MAISVTRQAGAWRSQEAPSLGAPGSSLARDRNGQTPAGDKPWLYTLTNSN